MTILSDNVLSIAVSSHEWIFFRDYNFRNQYLDKNQGPVALSVGRHPSVDDAGIQSDLSSLGPYN